MRNQRPKTRIKHINSEMEKDILNKQIAELQQSDLEFNAWKNATAILLERIFGKDYPGIKSIQSIKHTRQDLRAHGGPINDNINMCKKQGLKILEACITEIDTFGVPEKSEVKNSGFAINLTQNQTVSINLILTVLKDELTVGQYDEIQKVVHTDEPRSTKLKKVIEKIEGFGCDVASNILANILINPNIWN